jgi:hypothetical protein
MKLTPEKARELRKRGIKVDPRQIVREVREEQKPVAESVKAESPKADISPAILDGLVQVANASEANTKSILALHSAMLDTMAEISKPKKMLVVSTINRNARGEMSTVESVISVVK